MNQKKIKKLAEKLNVADAKLLEMAINDTENQIRFSPEQRIIIKKIKDKMKIVC